LAKHLHILHCTRDYDLDFVVISDMGRRDFTPSILNRLLDGIYFEWISRLGRGGGTLFSVRTYTMEVLAS
jgi:hypothetical protein